MDIGAVVEIIGQEYRNIGWHGRLCRVEGLHWYGQAVVDLRGLRRDEHSGGLVGTHTMLYMVPGHAVRMAGC